MKSGATNLHDTIKLHEQYMPIIPISNWMKAPAYEIAKHLSQHYAIILTSAVCLLTYLLTYGAEPFLRSHQLCSHSRTSQHFMEPEG
jgi:hypothetical protein